MSGDPKSEFRNPKETRSPKPEANRLRRAAIRLSAVGFRISDLVLALCLLAFPVVAQPKSDLTPPPYSAAEGDARARKLLERLLAEKPDQNATNTAVLKIYDRDENERLVPITIAVALRGTDWVNVYRVTGSGHPAGPTLTIVHAPGPLPNQYFLQQPGELGTSETPHSPAQLMLPFAGSDFWVVDLGMDFLHWPQQRVLRTQMRKSQNCDVLESTNPNPVPGGYARVRSWIAINQPEEIVIVHAEAFDSQGKRLKIFDPKTIRKVNGVWQLEDVEIRNMQKGTRTVIEFELKS